MRAHDSRTASRTRATRIGATRIRATLLAACCPILTTVAACGRETTAPGPARELTALPRALTPAEAKVRGAGNAFTFALFREIAGAQRDSNSFVSPLSASMALGMALNGAAGETYDQMRGALQASGLTQDEINAGYKGLISLLRGLDAATELRVANSIWYRDGFPVEASFLSAGTQWFDARIQALDFDSPSAPTAINDWVKTSTDGRIPTIVDGIDRDMMMYLINAIYFKGSWRERFDPANTSPATFHSVAGDQQVPMMRRTGTMSYAESPAWQAVELRYGNGAFAMTILLPRENGDIEALASTLTQDGWDAITGALDSTRVALELPRFTVTWKRDLIPDLEALGMTDAFGPSADFSRMSSTPLYISSVLQRSVVEVNEEGTVAAAATAAGMSITSMPQSVSVRVDRPFILAIRERLSGTVLFVGKIVALP